MIVIVCLWLSRHTTSDVIKFVIMWYYCVDISDGVKFVIMWYHCVDTSDGIKFVIMWYYRVDISDGVKFVIMWYYRVDISDGVKFVIMWYYCVVISDGGEGTSCVTAGVGVPSAADTDNSGSTDDDIIARWTRITNIIAGKFIPNTVAAAFNLPIGLNCHTGAMVVFDKLRLNQVFKCKIIGSANFVNTTRECSMVLHSVACVTVCVSVMF